MGIEEGFLIGLFISICFIAWRIGKHEALIEHLIEKDKMKRG